MPIQRQYSLPNCNLVLEGLTNDTIDSFNDPRPVLTILTNAECRFLGSQQLVSGGRAFFESLVKTVSSYAQEFLSGLTHPQEQHSEDDVVLIEKVISKHTHRLIHKTLFDGIENKTELELTTVQLFDLVEAIDQFLADGRTLPDFNLPLRPLSKRYRNIEEPLIQRAAPAALGVGGLALAAIALYFLPVPKVPEIKPINQTNPTETSQSSSSATSETSQSSSSETSETSQSSSSASVISTNDLKPEELEALLATAPEIKDATELKYIQRYLYTSINQAWSQEQREQNNAPLTFRISVGKDGSILTYSSTQGTPSSASRLTPLPGLVYTKPGDKIASQEPLAQFKVVFDKKVLEVSPWHGKPEGEATFGEEITDTKTIDQLTTQLAQTLRDNWKGDIDTSKELVYRVGVTADGIIADYEPDNRSAVDYEKETPLPQLVKPEAAGIVPGQSVIPQKPLGQFKVVLKPSGKVEVSPWK